LRAHLPGKPAEQVLRRIGCVHPQEKIASALHARTNDRMSGSEHGRVPRLVQIVVGTHRRADVEIRVAERTNALIVERKHHISRTYVADEKRRIEDVSDVEINRRIQDDSRNRTYVTGNGRVRGLDSHEAAASRRVGISTP